MSRKFSWSSSDTRIEMNFFTNFIYLTNIPEEGRNVIVGSSVKWPFHIQFAKLDLIQSHLETVFNKWVTWSLVQYEQYEQQCICSQVNQSKLFHILRCSQCNAMGRISGLMLHFGCFSKLPKFCSTSRRTSRMVVVQFF